MNENVILVVCIKEIIEVFFKVKVLVISNWFL